MGGRSSNRKKEKTLRSVKIQLSKGYWATVDYDIELLSRILQHCWYYGNAGYVKATINSEKVYLHRFILDVTGRYNQVDHKNGDKLDNRRCNLRVCTNAQNQANRRKSPGTSQYKGVHWHTRSKKWISKLIITDNGKEKLVFSGSYSCEIDAAVSYDFALVNYFGEFAKTNFEICQD